VASGKATTWLGVPTWKCPLDMWVYQEMIHDLRPDLNVETGTAYGGSALYMATLCDVLGRGQIVTVDLPRSAAHVLDELRAYAPLVTPGGYLVVEDTNINGHPVFDSFGPGPMEAVTKFLEASSAFVGDHSREKFLLTFNPSGWLRRV
jgi:cephalosporin hydroxylase